MFFIHFNQLPITVLKEKTDQVFVVGNEINEGNRTELQFFFLFFILVTRTTDFV